MTQKYLYVRRELYEQNPAKKLNSRRSFTDMAQLFKWLLWILLVIVAGCGIWIVVLMGMNPSSSMILIPMTLCTIAAIATLIPREKYLYHESARNSEIEQIQQQYQQYIIDVHDILNKQNVDSPKKLLKLKQECEDALRAHAEQFNKFGNRTYDLLIGVPLGALISGIIYADKEVTLVAIAAIIVVGVAIVGGIKIFCSIRFYTDGYFKDKYLLDALNELEYADEVCEKY